MKKISEKINAAAMLTAVKHCVATANAASVTIPGRQIPSLGTPPDPDDFMTFFHNFKTIGTAVSGVCTITALIFFIINVTKLSVSAGNDMQRARAVKGILFSGISLALFGSITIVAGTFWNAI